MFQDTIAAVVIEALLVGDSGPAPSQLLREPHELDEKGSASDNDELSARYFRYSEVVVDYEGP